MQPVPGALVLLLLAAALTGCSGFTIGVRQDEEDRARFARVLERAQPGRPFPARALLGKEFRRLFVFRGGGTTQDVEDAIGIPFPQSGDEVPKAGAYVVFDDGEQVLASFSFAGPVGATGRCLLTGRAPLAPADELVTVRPERGGAIEPSTVTKAGDCR